MNKLTEAKMRYAKKNIIRKSIDFNRNTESDIIEQLEKQKSYSRYIKDLILDDMKREEGVLDDK